MGKGVTIAVAERSGISFLGRSACANAVEKPSVSLRDPYSAQPLVKSTN
jgi:hypothetical protein